MPQQLSQFATKVYQPLTYLEVVFRIFVNTLRILCHIELLAQFALSAIGHERRI